MHFCCQAWCDYCCCPHAGADIRNKKQADAGLVLADTVRQIMYDLEVDDGLNAVGYTSEDIPGLVKGTLPQVRTA